MHSSAICKEEEEEREREREMGRGKIEIKRIENTSNRQVTYSKRRNGLIKKAKEISVLCDAKVSLIIFASSKKMHEYCSPSTKITDILDEYHRQSGKRLWDTKHENLNHEVDKIKKENDNLQIQLRHLKGEDITSLNYRELMALEEALENGLVCVRDQEMEVVKTYRRNHIALQKMLEEENRELNFDLQQQLREMTLAETEKLEVREDDQYRQRLRGCNSHHMPFSFRVQPIQPNLQDRD